MNTTILKALLRKEVTMMRRNPFIPRVIVMLPLMVMLVIPLVANMDVKHVEIAVVDNDRSQLSRRIAADMNASGNLSVVRGCDSYPEAFRLVEEWKADVVVTIPPDYERDLTRRQNPQIDIAANGVNATKGMLGANYAAQSVAGSLREWQAAAGMELKPSDTAVLNLYNPTLDFRNFMIPALIVMLIIIICGFLPALSLVSEKQTGTIEAMNVTPVGRMTFVLSKLIPYWVAGLIVVTVGMIVGRLVYGLAPLGNIGAIYLASILFSLVMSGLGLIISNKSNTVLQSILVMFAVIMVFQLMSGLFTPISSMPQWAQIITYAVPPRYFIEIMRGIYLKGAGIADLWQNYAILTAIAAALCLTAALTYRKQS